MVYVISFEVDNGTSFVDDVACIIADGHNDAIRKLRLYINSLNSETCVSKIYKVDLFSGDVFTGKHGRNR